VVLKLAERGCAVSTAQEEFHVPGLPVTPVDTTGAGDCFCAGFLAALHRGSSLHEAAQFANAVAAQSIQRVGGTEGV
jgi:ribokinase